MNKAERKRFLLPIIFFIIFCLAFFIPRYFANRMYDPTEDEFLSVIFSRDVELKDLLLKIPDCTHPGLWYILMKFPISLIGIDGGIAFYRYIQIFILFFCLVFSFFYFRKKLPSKFLFIFFVLFLSNIYLVHLSIQYRMFAMLLGIAAIYSLFWFELIKNKKSLSYRNAIFLSVLAILGFFTDYSMIWIIPLWPLIYLLNQKKTKDLKKIIVFAITFVLGTGWFVPVFFVNIQNSLLDNGWILPHTAKNTISLLLNSLGLVPLKDKSKFNYFVFPYLFVLAPIIWNIFKNKKQFYLKLMFIGVFLMFMFFLLVNYFADNRLFYVRAMLSLVAVFYILIADAIYSMRASVYKLLFFSLVFFQLSQFLIYFSQNDQLFKEYIHFDDTKHPISYFKEFAFLDNSCLIIIPHWNYASSKYFLGAKTTIFTIDEFVENYKNQKKYCDNVYVLDQISIERNKFQYVYDTLQQLGYQPKFLESNHNQALSILVKK